MSWFKKSLLNSVTDISPDVSFDYAKKRVILRKDTITITLEFRLIKDCYSSIIKAEEIGLFKNEPTLPS